MFLGRRSVDEATADILVVVVVVVVVALPAHFTCFCGSKLLVLGKMVVLGNKQEFKIWMRSNSSHS